MKKSIRTLMTVLLLSVIACLLFTAYKKHENESADEETVSVQTTNDKGSFEAYLVLPDALADNASSETEIVWSMKGVS